MGGIFKNGDEGAQLTFDDTTGILYIKGKTTERALHISACAWVEFAPTLKVNSVELTPEVLAASKANPEAFKKI